MPAKEESERPGFELQKYELDRAHEVELNKFAHALEIERLKLLQLLNGGAFTVLVAFASSVFGGAGPGPMLALLAASCWVFGLGTAAAATHLQLRSQRNVNQAYRFRRNAVEWRQLSKLFPDEDQLRRMVGPPLPGGGRANDQAYDRWAGEAVLKGLNEGKKVSRLGAAGIILFVTGALFLTASIWASPLPPPQKAEVRSLPRP